MDGEVVIKATLDDKEFDDKYDKLMRKAQRKETNIEIGAKEVEELNQKLSVQKESLSYIEKEYDEIAEKARKFAELEFKFKKNTMLPEDFVEYMSLEDASQKEQEILEQQYKIKKNISDTEQKLLKQQRKLQDLKEDYTDIVTEAERYKESVRKAAEITEKNKQIQSYNKIKDSIGGIGKSITKITKKVIRWSLAIFSIRGAYMAIRRAISVISEQDEQLGANIEYMRNALAYALEPIVRRIVEWLKQMMYYVGYLTKAWFGRNIFENANKSLKSASKSAKELKKQLAGFDEMNVLSSDSSAGGGAATPDFDLTKPEDMPIPGWLDWLAKNGDTVKLIVEAIGIGIASWKLANLIKDLGLLGSLPIWKLVAGIALTIAGLVIYIKKMIDYFKDPTWENFKGMLVGLALAATGVFLIFGGFPALIVTIIGLIAAITAAIIKNWDKIKDFFGKIIKWIKEKFIPSIKNELKATFEWTKKLIVAIADVFIGMLNLMIDALNTFLIPLRALILVVGKVLGKDWTLESIRIPRIPLLAKGGIINQPGRGVPVGNAIGGERGMEGVLPLTDSQQMALLGESIGKYVNISATIPVYVGNRQIAREIRKINAEDDFAYNR